MIEKNYNREIEFECNSISHFGAKKDNKPFEFKERKWHTETIFDRCEDRMYVLVKTSCPKCHATCRREFDMSDIFNLVMQEEIKEYSPNAKEIVAKGSGRGKPGKKPPIPQGKPSRE